MAKYSLIDRQKDMLHAASEGLRDGSVKQLWSYFTMPSDDSGFEVKLALNGFPQAEQFKITAADLSLFADLGFLAVRNEERTRGSYDVYEQRIHDAVDGDFEAPNSLSQSAATQNINIEQITGSKCKYRTDLREYNSKDQHIPIPS